MQRRGGKNSLKRGIVTPLQRNNHDYSPYLQRNSYEYSPYHELYCGSLQRNNYDYSPYVNYNHLNARGLSEFRCQMKLLQNLPLYLEQHLGLHLPPKQFNKTEFKVK